MAGNVIASRFASSHSKARSDSNVYCSYAVPLRGTTAIRTKVHGGREEILARLSSYVFGDLEGCDYDVDYAMPVTQHRWVRASLRIEAST